MSMTTTTSTKNNFVPGHNDARWLTLAGAAFLLLSGFYLWRDLALPSELVLLAAVALVSLAAVLRWPRAWPWAAPAALLGASVAGGLWFLGTKSPALLPALGAALVGAAVALARQELSDDWPRSPLPGQLTWYAAGAAFLAATWAFYFHFLTVGFASESLLRRLIPTVSWLSVGLALFIAGRARAQAALHVGLALVGVSLIKAVGYDTTHLHGWMRVAVLGAVGVLLLAGAGASRVSRRSADEDEAF